ncbi:HEAT repeat domain-containing protein [Verrucomicrobium sp. BvORR034]|uniref:HEAT repeat domain-containing protein n=1 Tax=Verrucomicrobium sp. BvORR034 TaxID=1396418 RepID=UPI0022410453|nr:HEAT repeat domain-containing protein [Verrucomicrobium sp. BvORR034]
MLSCVSAQAKQDDGTQVPIRKSATTTEMAAEVSAMARWSEPVNGLAARVDFVDPWGPAGYVVLVQLRNVGSSPLRVPMGNPPDSQLARLFELHKHDRKGAWHRVPWMPGEHLEGDGPKVERGGVIYAGHSAGQDIVRPPVVLQPGEGALVYLWGDRSGGDSWRHPLDVKIVLRLREGQNSTVAVDGPPLTMSKGGKSPSSIKTSNTSASTWTGVLETPPFPTRRAIKLHVHRRGQLECPTILPPVSYAVGHPLTRDLWGTQFEGLCQSNIALDAAVDLYQPLPMRSILEKRMAEASPMVVKLLIALPAPRMGSEPATSLLKNWAQTTEWREVRELHRALSHLLHCYGHETPPWVLVVVEKVLTDDRKLTFDRSSAGAGGVAARTVLEHATVEERLPLALARTKCPGAFSVLEANFKKYPSDYGVLALTWLGDPRAAPLLMDALRTRTLALQPSSWPDVDDLSRAVAKFRIQEAVPLLMEHSKSPEAVTALGRLGDLRARDYLEKLVNKEPGQMTEVSLAARIALAALEPDKRRARFEELLKGPFNDRWRAIEVVKKMAELEDPSLNPLFMAYVATSDDKHVVCASVEHLGRMKAREAVPVLLGSFDCKFDPETDNSKSSYTGGEHRANVVGALELISGEELGPDLEPWMIWWKQQPKL